jgi:hypothetical protein
MCGVGTHNENSESSPPPCSETRSRASRTSLIFIVRFSRTSAREPTKSPPRRHHKKRGRVADYHARCACRTQTSNFRVAAAARLTITHSASVCKRFEPDWHSGLRDSRLTVSRPSRRESRGRIRRQSINASTWCPAYASMRSRYAARPSVIKNLPTVRLFSRKGARHPRRPAVRCPTPHHERHYSRLIIPRRLLAILVLKPILYFRQPLERPSQ